MSGPLPCGSCHCVRRLLGVPPGPLPGAPFPQPRQPFHKVTGSRVGVSTSAITDSLYIVLSSPSLGKLLFLLQEGLVVGKEGRFLLL